MINRGLVTFLKQLQAHRGGLIRLKTQLYWYGGRGWDKNRGRLCLLLDVDRGIIETDATAAGAGGGAAAALLLIDGRAQWVRVAERDVEFELD